jgi:hypothetical protein
MERRFSIFRIACAICIACGFTTLPETARAQTAEHEFVSRDADIKRARIHYMTGGSGTRADPPAWICGNLANVGPGPTGTRREIYSDRTEGGRTTRAVIERRPKTSLLSQECHANPGKWWQIVIKR